MAPPIPTRRAMATAMAPATVWASGITVVAMVVATMAAITAATMAAIIVVPLAAPDTGTIIDKGGASDAGRRFDRTLAGIMPGIATEI